MAAKTRLLVTGAFLDYRPGDRITEAAEMKRVVAEYPDYVLREAMPAEPKEVQSEVPVEGDPAATTVSAKTPKPGTVTKHNLTD